MTGPRRFGEQARAFVGRSAARDAVLAAEVLDAWAEVAGPEIARHTEGSRFRKGELQVYVDSPAWANELQLMGEHLKERLAEKTGKDTVRTIRFTVSERVGEKKGLKATEDQRDRLYSPVGQIRERLSETERRAVEETAGQVEDADVREALKRAMVVSLRIRGGRGKTRR